MSSAPSTTAAAIAAARLHQGPRLVGPLVCPYHQWTYDLDGKLAVRPPDGRRFRQERLRPEAVHCESVAGYIFICLAKKAPDFQPVRA
jgi:Rieske 2Fe-2S family protein